MTHGGGTPARSGGRSRSAAGLALPLAAAAGLVGAGVLTAAAAQAAPPPKNGKVTLCHATPPASAKNGWVQITVSTNAVTHAGHGQHADDIIPAFSYYRGRAPQYYPGKNMNTTFYGSTGAQILANGCRLPAVPTSAPASSSSAASSSAAASTSAPAATSAASVPTESSSSASGVESASSSSEAPNSASVPSEAPPSSAGVVATAAANLPGSAEAGANGSAAVEAAAAQRAAAPANAAHAGIAVGDTGDNGGSGSPTALTATVIGGAAAGLIGLGVLAYRRRQRWFADGPGAGE